MAKQEFQLSEGVTVEELSGPIYETFKAANPLYPDGFIKLQPYNQMLPRMYLNWEKKIKEFETKQDDVWVASYPKCGTTWTQEMVWCIMNNYDYEGAKATILDERVPFIELSAIYEMPGLPDTVELARNLPEPRIIKTHLSWDMLPNTLINKGKGKVVYVTRNPRDACVSMFHFTRLTDGYTGTLEEFTECFVNDYSHYAPFLHHVRQYWEKQGQASNVLFITFEDMKKDLASVVVKVANFLEKPLPKDDEAMQEFLDHLSFKKMRTNKAVNKHELIEDVQKSLGDKAIKTDNPNFMRKGKSGDWKSQFSPEVVAKFEAWEQSWLKDSDLKFCYEVTEK